MGCSWCLANAAEVGTVGRRALYLWFGSVIDSVAAPAGACDRGGKRMKENDNKYCSFT